MFRETISQNTEIQVLLKKLPVFKAARVHPSKVVQLPILSNGVDNIKFLNQKGVCLMNCFLLSIIKDYELGLHVFYASHASFILSLSKEFVS